MEKIIRLQKAKSTKNLIDQLKLAFDVRFMNEQQNMPKKANKK